MELIHETSSSVFSSNNKKCQRPSRRSGPVDSIPMNVSISLSYHAPTIFGSNSAKRFRISSTQFGNFLQRWSRSSTGLQSQVTKTSVLIGTSGRPNLRSVQHLSLTLDSPMFSSFANARTASLNLALASGSSLGTHPVMYTCAHTPSTCASVLGMMDRVLGDGPVFPSSFLKSLLACLGGVFAFLSSKSSISLAIYASTGKACPPARARAFS